MTPGISVMLGMLSGDVESQIALRSCLGKTIRAATLGDDDKLSLGFTDGSTLVLWDDGQSCCESRYMRTDDELNIAGQTLLGAEVVDGPSSDEEYGDVHEIQFLNLTLSGGVVQFSNHVEHNGYYGGFMLRAALDAPEAESQEERLGR